MIPLNSKEHPENRRKKWLKTYLLIRSKLVYGYKKYGDWKQVDLPYIEIKIKELEDSLS